MRRCNILYLINIECMLVCVCVRWWAETNVRFGNLQNMVNHCLHVWSDYIATTIH